MEQLEEILGYCLEPLHIVGGGTQNELLSQFTADATAREVITGPIEATAAGNILMQMMALGQFSTLAQARQVARHSFALSQFQPGDRAGWDQAYSRLLGVMQSTDRVCDRIR